MAWDWLKKYMVGQMGTPGVPDTIGMPSTSGLFGTGGNFGKGGLLTTFNQPGTSGLYNMFANPYINIGAAMAAKGFQGKGVGESLFPSVKEGLSFTEGVEKIKSSRKKRELIKKYADKVPKKHKEEFLYYGRLNTSLEGFSDDSSILPNANFISCIVGIYLYS